MRAKNEIKTFKSVVSHEFFRKVPFVKLIPENNHRFCRETREIEEGGRKRETDRQTETETGTETETQRETQRETECECVCVCVCVCVCEREREREREREIKLYLRERLYLSERDR